MEGIYTMRTTKQERKENARNFYYALLHNCYKIAVIVKRDSSEFRRCQFLVAKSLIGNNKPIVIAESNEGVSGCFAEFISNNFDGIQKAYLGNDFNIWLMKELHIKISYDDGYVIMLERI